MQQSTEHREKIRRPNGLENPDEHKKTNSNNVSVKNANSQKKSNKFVQALTLPTLFNINPRSIYNKIDEFHNFVKEEEVDVIFISESWEREHLPLEEIIKLEDFITISNVSQRKEV